MLHIVAATHEILHGACQGTSVRLSRFADDKCKKLGRHFTCDVTETEACTQRKISFRDALALVKVM